MRIRHCLFISFLSAVATIGCTPVTVNDYAAFEPEIQLEEFFNGDLTAHGVVKDRSGRVIRYFNADITASWENGQGTLDEDFVFNDGAHEKRVWKLSPADDGRYIATAGDVIGDGSLTVAGNSVFLDYVLRIPYGDSTIDLRVDDRMYLLSPDVLINESELSKFGVKVGSILLVILRADAVPAPSSLSSS